MIATPIASTVRGEKRAIRLIATMLKPIDQITPRKTSGGPKLKANDTTVMSRKISHKPRLSRKRVSEFADLPFAFWNRIDTPARKTNVGAHKWVIHRVANNNG